MAAKLIIVTGILLIAYAVYATVQKARGKSGSGCCGGREAVLPKPVADTDVIALNGGKNNHRC